MKRESDAVAPLEFCRAELAAPLHVTEVAEDWCRDLNALAGRVFARDRDALRRVETALSRSGDWYGLVSTIQSATQHYTNESFSIWGDACMQMVRRQAELVEGIEMQRKDRLHLRAAAADFFDGRGLEHHDLAVELAENLDAFGVALVFAGVGHPGWTIPC